MSASSTCNNHWRWFLDEQFVEGWILKSKNRKVDIMLVGVHGHFSSILTKGEKDSEVS